MKFRITPLLAALVLSGALLVTPAMAEAPPPVAQAQQKKDQPAPTDKNDPDVSASSVAILGACVPDWVREYRSWKSYCKNPSYKKGLNQAVLWARAHPNDRGRVPFPGKKALASGKNKRAWVTYIVYYYDRAGTKQVWKYGITSQDEYTRRSADGARACSRYFKTYCKHTYVAATDHGSGRYRYKTPYFRARFWEASLFLKWSRAHGGKCPPGGLRCI